MCFVLKVFYKFVYLDLREKVRKIPPSPVNSRNEAKRIKPGRPAVSSYNFSSQKASVRETSVNSIKSETREESLRHYNGHANLLDIKTQKRKSETDADDPFESDTSSKVDDRPPLPPAAQRRYKRQPTIENAVCFQEVGGVIDDFSIIFGILLSYHACHSNEYRKYTRGLCARTNYWVDLFEGDGLFEEGA